MDEQIRLRYLKDMEYFSAKIEKDPKSKVFMPLALAYLKLGKFDEVINVCKQGLEHHPDYLAAKTIMSQAMLEKGIVDEAKDLLIEVATINKSNYRANKLLADIYRYENNIPKAIYYYRTAIQSSPEDSDLKLLIEELSDTVDTKPANLEEIEFEENRKDVAGTEEELATTQEVLEDDTKLEEYSVFEEEIDKEAPSELDESLDEIELKDDKSEDDAITKDFKLENELDEFVDDFEIDPDALEIEDEEEKGLFEESIDVVDSVSTDEKEQEEVSLIESNNNVKEDNFESIVDEKIDFAISGDENSLQKKYVIPDVNKLAISRLENWLENIKKVKSSRDV